MHKIKSTHTIINIIHLILWIRSFQTYQHPRSNDINEMEEEGSQNKHKKGKKLHSASRKSISCRGKSISIVQFSKKQVTYNMKSISALRKSISSVQILAKTPFKGMKLDLNKYTNTLWSHLNLSTKFPSQNQQISSM